ncbi:CBS domain-containing protein [Streptomyces sp. NPDC005336]|uniref:CBS domain-containing protein n=1 Tax=unclassified Streptomyces TaxID=2593676 RepID=UPI0033ACF96F
MTLVQMQSRPADPAPTTVFAAMDASAPQVCDDMTVELASSVMAGAHVGHLLLCDKDDQCTGLVTRAQLAVVRDSPSYTDRIRLRDVVDAGERSPRP